MNIDQIAHALGSAKRTTVGWTCRCPAHEDHNPSLTLSNGRGARILWHCHAGCGQQAVLDELLARDLLGPRDGDRDGEPPGGMSPKGEYRPIIPVPSGAPSPASYHSPRGRPDSLWIYHCADGAIAGAVARWDVPNDKIIRPLTYCLNGSGSPAWHETGMPSPRPLFGLPQILADRTKPILVTEGEKAADGAARRFKGHIATTPAHGAHSPHLSDWSAVAQRDVVIWPDNDEAGRSYAERVAELANQAGALSVSIVPVPAAFPDKWDLADPTPEGFSLDSILDMAAEWKGDAAARAKPDDWPEPDLSIVSTHREPAPELPLDVFGPFWSDFIQTTAEAKGAPPDYVAGPLISSIGVLLVTARWAQPWPGWVEPPIWWTASIGLPSTNKSPGGDAIAEPMRVLEEELNATFDDRIRAWKTDKAAAEVRKKLWEDSVVAAVKGGTTPPRMPEDAEEPERPEPRRIIISDVTPEKVVRISAANRHGILLIRDELAGWFGGMDRYGGSGSERALWLEAYGGRPYTMDRVKADKPIRTRMLAIAITGGIQPDRLATMILAGDDDGLAARINYSWPEARRPTRPTRRVDLFPVNHRLQRLSELSGLTELSEPAWIPFSEQAANLLQEWREEVAEKENGSSGLFLSWLGKLPGNAARLALILEYMWWLGERMTADEPKVISAAAATAAIGYLDGYAVPMARRAFGDAALPQAEKDATAIAKWIMAQDPLPAKLNARALRHGSALPSARDAERYDAALLELADAGWVREDQDRAGPTRGRRRKDWAVNPKLGARR